MKTFFVIMVFFLFVSKQNAQNRFDELKNYCDNHETILQMITSPGSYGYIEVNYQGNASGSYVEVTSPNIYVYRYPNPHKKWLLLSDIFVEHFVWLTGGGEAVSPNVYVSPVKNNMQVLIIKTFHDGSINGNYELMIVDSSTKMLYDVKLPGSYLEKIVYLDNVLVVEQKESDYHQLCYLKTYSMVSIVNNTIVTDNYQRIISVEYK